MPTTFDKWLDEITEHLQKKEQQKPKPSIDQNYQSPPAVQVEPSCPHCQGPLNYLKNLKLFECNSCLTYFTDDQLREISP